MVDLRLKAQRQTILHYWLSGTQSPKEIHELTNIPLRTIKYNLKKLQDTKDIEHKKGNGRPSKVTQTVSRSIGQFVHRNTAVSTRQLALKVQAAQNISISHNSIWRHEKKKL